MDRSQKVKQANARLGELLWKGVGGLALGTLLGMLTGGLGFSVAIFGLLMILWAPIAWAFAMIDAGTTK